MSLPSWLPYEFAAFPTWSGIVLSDEWFSDRVCTCRRYELDPKYDWHKEFEVFQNPPCDLVCGKWLNRCMTCARCHVMFYQFFRHPHMGYHSKRGWFCWNCLDQFLPGVVEPRLAKLPKVPPPAVILPPGTELYVPRKLW